MARSSTSSLSRSGSSISVLAPHSLCQTAENDFKTLVSNISDALEEIHVDKIRYLYKSDLGAEGDKLGALKILARLEENGVFSFRIVFPLIELLQRIRRFDLVRSVESYAEAHSGIVTDPVQGQLRLDMIVVIFCIDT